jgi:hypothetical protein
MQPLSKQVQSPKSQSPNRSGVEGIAGPSNGASKRPASDTPEFSPATKIYIMDGSQNTPAEHHTPPDETFASTSTKSPTNGSRVYFTGPHAPLPFYLTRPHSPIPYHPHPPLKQWPNDYTVSEIAAGFRLMDGLVAQTPTVVQRTAFERVFGCRYVKSTVCRHRGVWRRANAELREAFEALGADEKAVWGEFVRRVEGRPPGKIGQSKDHILAQSQGQTALICDHEPSSVVGALPGRPVQEEEEAEEEESFMRSLELPHPTVHQSLSSPPFFWAH